MATYALSFAPQLSSSKMTLVGRGKNLFIDKKKRSLYCKILKDVLPNIYFNFSVYILLRRAGISVKRLVHKHSVLNMDFTGMTHTNNIESLILIYV